jgi:hypothetical protein
MIAVLLPEMYKIATGCTLKIMFLELERRMLKNVKKPTEEITINLNKSSLKKSFEWLWR